MFLWYSRLDKKIISFKLLPNNKIPINIMLVKIPTLRHDR